MANVRNRIVFSYSFSNLYGTQSATANKHPDELIQHSLLHWNTGSGYRDTYCAYIASGGSKSNGLKIYVGSGNPDEASISVPNNTKAEALVGQYGGTVGGPVMYGGIQTNAWIVSTGVQFTEYEQSASVNNSSLGYINILTGAGYVQGSSLSWKCSPSNLTIPNLSEYVTNANCPNAYANAGSNATLVGWWKNGSKWGDPLFHRDEDYSAVAVFGKKFILKFDANGGSGTAIANKTYYYGIEEYEQQGKIPEGTFSRNRYRFTGWNTVASPTAQNPGVHIDDRANAISVFEDLELVGNDTVTLYAEWEYTAFNITVNKANTAVGGQSVAAIGTLSLFDITNNETVATESNGVLYYEGTAGTHYRIICTMPDTKPHILWTANGVYEDGEYIANYDFTPATGAILTKNFYFTKRALYSFTTRVLVYDKDGSIISTNPPVCTAVVTSPSEPDEEGKYVEGRIFTIEGTPASGYAMTSANVGGYSYSQIENNTFSTNQEFSSNTEAVCNFTKIVYGVSATKDAGSSSVISSVTVDCADATYGDTATFRAVMADGAWSFAGWYDGETLVSANAVYVHTVTGDTHLTARAKVSVALAIHYDASASDHSCSLIVNDSAYTSGTTFDVILGRSFTYELILGLLQSGGSVTWLLDAWFNANDTQRTSPLDYTQSGTITPTGNMSIVADVVSVPATKTLVVTIKNDESEPYATIADANALSVYPEPATSAYAAGVYTFTFSGSKSVRLTANEEITVGSDTLSFSGFKEDGKTLVENAQYTFFLTNSSRAMTAFYGSTGVRTTTLAYGRYHGEVGNRTMGEFAITGTSDEAGVISTDGHSATVSRGKTITISVTPRNGYKFLGWYTTYDIGGSPYIVGTESVMTVRSERVLYACFAADPNAVYIWEGSTANKSFEWRSKTYAFSRPSNMVGCRVDAIGYSDAPGDTRSLIELDVDMFSAPNSTPTAHIALDNIVSQDCRRLPVRRPERYLQIAVRHDHEVDAIVVGTNMTELAK